MYLTKKEVYEKLENNDNFKEYYETVACCYDIIIKPMFNNIDKGDYLYPIKQLSSYYNFADYYSTLEKKYENINLRENMLSFDGFNSDLDNILMQYCKCRENMRITISVDDGIGVLLDKNNTNIVGIKKININYKQLLGFIYQVECIYKSPARKYSDLTDRAKALMGDKKIIELWAIFYEDMILDTLGISNIVYETDKFMSVVELSQIVCSKNCFRLYQFQRLDRILLGEYSHSMNLLLTYKKWLYKNVSLLDQMRFMIFSSTVLYSLGVRNVSDLDLMMIDLGDAKETTRLNDSVKVYLEDEETRFPFIDFSKKATDGQWYCHGKCTEYLSQWFDKEWPMLYKSVSMIETVYNPKFHYYYLGIKVQHMEADIKRRMKRNRPAAFADLFAVNFFTRCSIDMEKLDEGYWKNHEYYKFTEQEISKMLSTIKFYLRKKYGLIIDISIIKNFLKIE